MFNVEYDRGDGTVSRYCMVPLTTREQAEEVRKNFEDRYVGKLYPNGKGFYPFTNPRVVRV